MNTNEIFNGTNGSVFISTDDTEDLIGSMQTFTVHQANETEDINEAEFLGKKKRVVGYEVTGTLTKFKMDSAFINIMEKYKNGDTPSISFMGKAYNPATKITQVIKVIGVTFNEMDLINLEQKKTTVEEIPYSAEDYKWINK